MSNLTYQDPDGNNTDGSADDTSQQTPGQNTSGQQTSGQGPADTGSGDDSSEPTDSNSTQPTPKKTDSTSGQGTDPNASGEPTGQGTDPNASGQPTAPAAGKPTGDSGTEPSGDGSSPPAGDGLGSPMMQVGKQAVDSAWDWTKGEASQHPGMALGGVAAAGVMGVAGTVGLYEATKFGFRTLTSPVRLAIGAGRVAVRMANGATLWQAVRNKAPTVPGGVPGSAPGTAAVRASRSELAVARRTLRYDTASKYKFSVLEGGQTAETEYASVLKGLSRNPEIAKLGSVHARDIEDALIKIDGRPRARFRPADITAIEERAEKIMQRMQNEGRVGEDLAGTAKMRVQPSDIRQLFGAKPKIGAVPEVLSDAAQENRLYKQVVQLASKDAGGAPKAINSGDIHHYIRQAEDGEDYLAKGLGHDAKETTHLLQREKFLTRMQTEGRLSATAGADGKFAVQSTKAGVGLLESEGNTVAENMGRMSRVKVAVRWSRLGGGLRNVGAGEAEAMEIAGTKAMGMRIAGKLGGPVFATAIAGFEVYQASKSHDKKTIASASGHAAGSLAGGLVGAEVGAEGGAAIGAGIGAFFFGAGAVPGAAIGGFVGGLGGGIVGAWKGGEWGRKATEHFFGHPTLGQDVQPKSPEDFQRLKMETYAKLGANQMNDSDLLNQAHKDGFKDLNEAHFAGTHGFDDSSQLHKVMVAAQNAHIGVQELFDVIKAQGKGHGISGAAIAEYLGHDKNAIQDVADAIRPSGKPSGTVVAKKDGSTEPGTTGAAPKHHDYTLASAENFGAHAVEQKAQMEKILTTAVNPATGKPYLAAGASEADTINAMEALLHDKGLYSGPMNDGAMGSGVRNGMLAFLNTNGAPTVDPKGKFDQVTVATLATATEQFVAKLQTPPNPTGDGTTTTSSTVTNGSDAVEANSARLQYALNVLQPPPPANMPVTSVPISPGDQQNVAALARQPVMGRELDRSDIDGNINKVAKDLDKHFNGQFKVMSASGDGGMHQLEDGYLRNFLADGAAVNAGTGSGRAKEVYFQYTGDPAGKADFYAALSKSAQHHHLLDSSRDLNQTGQQLAASAQPGEVETPGSVPKSGHRGFFGGLKHVAGEIGGGVATFGEQLYYDNPPAVGVGFGAQPAPFVVVRQPPQHQDGMNQYNGNRAGNYRNMTPPAQPPASASGLPNTVIKGYDKVNTDRLDPTMMAYYEAGVSMAAEVKKQTIYTNYAFNTRFKENLATMRATTPAMADYYEAGFNYTRSHDPAVMKGAQQDTRNMRDRFNSFNGVGSPQ